MPRGGYPRLPARPGPHRSLRATFLIQLPSLPRRESSRESSSALRFLERLGLHPPTAPYRQSMGDPPKHRVCPFQHLRDQATCRLDKARCPRNRRSAGIAIRTHE